MHCYSNFQVWLIFFLLIAKSKAIAIFVHDLNLQNFLYCRGYFTLRCLVVLLCFPPPLSQASWLFQKDWITASTTLQQAWNFAQKSFLFSTSDKDIPSAAAVNLSPSSRIHKKKPKACNQNHIIIISGFSKNETNQKTCLPYLYSRYFQVGFPILTLAPLGFNWKLSMKRIRLLALNYWFCTQVKVFSNVLPFFSLSEEAYAREDFY